MLNWFSQRLRSKRSAQNLYGSIVTASRRPVLYEAYGAPDTPEGRFEVLLAHLFLVLERLREDGESASALSQGLVDAFFADMDVSMRERGVGDMAVPKKMRDLASVVYERMGAYREAMAVEGNDRLAELLKDALSMERAVPAGAYASFAHYMRNALGEFRRYPAQELHNGVADVSVKGEKDAEGQGHETKR